MLRLSEIDWTQPDCQGWYSYCYRSGDVRQVPPPYCVGRNYPGSMTRARGGVKVLNLMDTKILFDEKEKKGRERSGKELKSPVGKMSRTTTAFSEKVKAVPTEGQVGLRSTVPDQVDIVKAIQFITAVVKVMVTCVLPFVRVVRYRLLSIVGWNPMLSMHRLIPEMIERLPPSMCPMEDKLAWTRVALLVIAMGVYFHELATLKRMVI